MKVIFLAYSNASNDPLPNLQEEDEQIYQYLSARALRQHFLVHRDPYTSAASIATYLTLYRDHIQVFHFSGHAGSEKLLMGDAESRSEGVAHLLAQCPNLRLVILNGCSTFDQVKLLLELGVPVVIGTYSPVSDHAASLFARRFFQALSESATVEKAFELGIGEALMDKPIAVYRDLAPLESQTGGQALWGLFYKPENEQYLNYQLPHHSNSPPADGFTPNEKLTESLWEIIAPFSSQVRALRLMAGEGEAIEKGDKQIAIINSLPRPIGWHLRKLMAPIDQLDQGYDKISEARLRQICTVFETYMEFLCTILLAQIWDAQFESENLEIPADLQRAIEEYLTLQPVERSQYHFYPFLQSLAAFLEEKQVSCFVSELDQLSNVLDQSEFSGSCLFLHILRKRLQEDPLHASEIRDYCIRGEDALIEVFRALGFLAKYVLAAIKSIDVERYRHLVPTRYRHNIVKLMRVFGDLQLDEINIEKALFNRSVLLLNRELFNKNQPLTSNGMDQLSLSPLIFDENAFKSKTDLSRLYFLSYYNTDAGTCFYKDIQNPNQQLLEVSEENYQLMKVQFEVFKDMLWQQQ